MAANELIGIFNSARAGKKKKKPAPTGIFPPGEGGSMTPQTYENWKENVQGGGDLAELIDTMRRYNPPSTGRSPQSMDSKGWEMMNEMNIPPDAEMAYQGGKANALQADVFKQMALDQTGIGGEEAMAQMGQFRDAAAQDEKTNMGILGRAIGANMGNRSPQSIPELSRPSNTMGSGAGSLYKEAMSPEALAMLKKIRESETMKLGRDFSRNAVGQPNVTATSTYAPPTSSYSDSVGALTGAGVSEPGKISASTRDVEKEFFPARRRATRTRIKSRLKSQMY